MTANDRHAFEWAPIIAPGKGLNPRFHALSLPLNMPTVLFQGLQVLAFNIALMFDSDAARCFIELLQRLAALQAARDPAAPGPALRL